MYLSETNIVTLDSLDDLIEKIKHSPSSKYVGATDFIIEKIKNNMVEDFLKLNYYKKSNLGKYFIKFYGFFIIVLAVLNFSNETMYYNNILIASIVGPLLIIFSNYFFKIGEKGKMRLKNLKGNKRVFKRELNYLKNDINEKEFKEIISSSIVFNKEEFLKKFILPENQSFYNDYILAIKKNEFLDKLFSKLLLYAGNEIKTDYPDDVC